MSAPSGLTIRNSIDAMEIGDCIPFRAAGDANILNISEVGTCTSAEIPYIGAQYPDGLAYFIKVDKGLLISDRVVQNNKSWDKLNTDNLIEGKVMYNNPIIPQGITATDNQGYIITTNSIYNDNDGYNPYRMFIGGKWGTKALSRSDLLIELPAPQYICGLIFYINYVYGAAFTLEGSNDNISFDMLVPLNYISNYQTLTIGSNYSSIKYKYVKFSLYGGGSYEIRSFNIFARSNPYGIFRSIKGGNAYLGSDGKPSLTYNTLGCYPTNNEWDKYIVKSNLNGKVTPGDDNIWHWSVIGSWSQNTPSIGMIRMDNGLTADASHRIVRCETSIPAWHKDLTTPNINSSSSANVAFGFRPVFEYVESSSKQTNMWY